MILLVDDDEDLLIYHESFLKYDGYKVDAFTDPVDAYPLLETDVY